MAFCNSCGATLTEGTKFCNKCGAAVSAGPPARPAAPPAATSRATSAPAPAPTTGSSALKIVLIVIAVIVGIGILGLATVGIIGYRIAKGSHVRQEGGQVKVETPFGTVETSKDPEKAAKELGIDIYPGAQVQQNGASSATFGGMHTAAARFESGDSVDKVCAFYKSRLPNSVVTSSDQNRCTIVSNAQNNDQKNMITINAEARGDSTDFQITNVSKKAAPSN